METLSATAPLLSASIIIVRESAASEGFEVLLMERNANTSSFGGTLVFPGGKVDLGDERIAHNSAGKPTSLPASFKLSLLQQEQLIGAALRETVEEVGILWQTSSNRSGDMASPNATGLRLRQALQQGQTWANACQTLQIQPDAAPLQVWSRWITPTTPNMSVKRFDTLFFLAQMPAHETAQADGDEAAHLEWASPKAFLQRFAHADIQLAPPQIMTLAHLSRFNSIAALQAHARQQHPYCVEPVTQIDGASRCVCFPGDPQHPLQNAVMPGPTRLEMREGRFAPIAGWGALFD